MEVNQKKLNKNYMNKIEIERVENGWIITYWDEYEDTGLPYSKKILFSYQDEDKELESLKDMLLEVNEQVGIISSKYNKKNINIEII